MSYIDDVIKRFDELITSTNKDKEVFTLDDFEAFLRQELTRAVERCLEQMDLKKLTYIDRHAGVLKEPGIMFYDGCEVSDLRIGEVSGYNAARFDIENIKNKIRKEMLNK